MLPFRFCYCYPFSFTGKLFRLCFHLLVASRPLVRLMQWRPYANTGLSKGFTWLADAFCVATLGEDLGMTPYQKSFIGKNKGMF